MRMACVCLLVCLAGIATGCASFRARAQRSTLRSQWGIEIASLRMSGNGHLIDFRYRVLDPDKAAMLGDERSVPSMIDEATGTKLRVPSSPKIGPLRQSSQRMEQGRTYFIIFANAGRLVKSGSEVTITIGDFHVENLTVE